MNLEVRIVKALGAHCCENAECKGFSEKQEGALQDGRGGLSRKPTINGSMIFNYFNRLTSPILFEWLD
jgi:hypothetical protein